MMGERYLSNPLARVWGLCAALAMGGCISSTALAAGPTGRAAPVRQVELTLGGIAIDSALQAPREGEVKPRYRFELPANTAAEINLGSDEFDAMLNVYDSPTSTDAIRSDDDGGGGNNARVILQNPDTRQKIFYLEVDSWDPLPGKFRLSAVRVQIHKAPAPTVLLLGTPAPGTIGPASPLDPDSSRRYVDYVLDFTGSRPQRVALLAKAEPPLDLELELTSNGRKISSDDDSGDGLNPLLVFHPAAGEKYVVRVIGEAKDSSAFTVEAGGLVDPRPGPPDAKDVEIDRPLVLAIAEDQPVLPGNQRPYALARLKGKAGDKFAVRATTSPGGALVSVQVGHDTGAGFAVLQRRFGAATTFLRNGHVDILVTAPMAYVGNVELTVRNAEPSPERAPAR